MRTVKVSTKDLLVKVEANLVKHDEIVKAAWEGYHKAVLAALKAQLDAAERGEKVSLSVFTELTPPHNQSEDYKTVIEMLKMSEDESVELSAQEFKQYVENKWHWRDQFIHQNSKYSALSL